MKPRKPMKRTPMKRGTSELKRTPMKRSETEIERKPMKRGPSAKVSDFARELDEVTPALVVRSKNRCEAGFPGCEVELWTAHRHHRKLRKQGGTNDLENLLLVCRTCHDFGHLNRNIARKTRFVVSANKDPKKLPFRRLEDT